jgi:hypothetical protein
VAQRSEEHAICGLKKGMECEGGAGGGRVKTPETHLLRVQCMYAIDLNERSSSRYCTVSTSLGGNDPVLRKTRYRP